MWCFFCLCFWSIWPVTFRVVFLQSFGRVGGVFPYLALPAPPVFCTIEVGLYSYKPMFFFRKQKFMKCQVTCRVCFAIVCVFCFFHLVWLINRKNYEINTSFYHASKYSIVQRVIPSHLLNLPKMEVDHFRKPNLEVYMYISRSFIVVFSTQYLGSWGNLHQKESKKFHLLLFLGSLSFCTMFFVVWTSRVLMFVGFLPPFYHPTAPRLANAEKPVVARQLAGLLLKNGLAAKDLTRDRELKQRWVSW